jgi:hypothetical protein
VCALRHSRARGLQVVRSRRRTRGRRRGVVPLLRRRPRVGSGAMSRLTTFEAMRVVPEPILRLLLPRRTSKRKRCTRSPASRVLYVRFSLTESWSRSGSDQKRRGKSVLAPMPQRVSNFGAVAPGLRRIGTSATSAYLVAQCEQTTSFSHLSSPRQARQRHNDCISEDPTVTGVPSLCYRSGICMRTHLRGRRSYGSGFVKT